MHNYNIVLAKMAETLNKIPHHIKKARSCLQSFNDAKIRICIHSVHPWQNNLIDATEKVQHCAGHYTHNDYQSNSCKCNDSQAKLGISRNLLNKSQFTVL